MTYLQFATCDRQSALRFLQKLYPSTTVTDTPDDAGPVLDLVEQDVFRIPDPDMHGKRVAIYPSKNFVEAKADSYRKVLSDFHAKH